MHHTIATIRDPNAIEPPWYLKSHETPEPRDELLSFLELWEKYQEQAPTMMMNCWAARRKARVHMRPKNKKYIIFLVLWSHLTVLY